MPNDKRTRFNELSLYHEKIGRQSCTILILRWVSMPSMINYYKVEIEPPVKAINIFFKKKGGEGRV